jgi:hypothetical protein
MEWQIIDIVSGKSLTLAFRATDIPSALGIEIGNFTKIPDSALHDFCKKMTGQIRDFVFYKDDNFIDPKNVSINNEEQTIDSMKHFDDYPFYEVELKLRAQEDFKNKENEFSEYLFPSHLIKLMREQTNEQSDSENI